MSNSTNETSNLYDCQGCYQNQQCPDFPSCVTFCPNFLCHLDVPYIYLPPPFPDREKSPILIVIPIIFAGLLVLSTLATYLKSRLRRSSLPETAAEPRDEGHAPIADQPIGGNNTVGLQPYIVHLIAVFKYKKGEGLVEGTDCSVCLNEFEEDESLRLLPNCSHAFHITCIDTWLRSNTTCPMCRASIVVEDLRGTEDQVVVMEDDKDQFVSVGTRC